MQDARPSHIPVERSVDEIFKEDEKHKQTNDFYSLDGQVTVENGPEPLTVIEKWEETEFDEIIMNNNQRSNYSFPRNFQKYAMPLIMDGFDVKGQAETGSGKSAAFLLPIVQKLHDEFKDQEETEPLCSVSALIIEPTRELAAQLHEQAKKFAYETTVRVNVAYDNKVYLNGESIYQNGYNILVGTPSWLIDFMSSDDRKAQFLKYDKLKFLVLDEADELLKLSFMPEVQKMVTSPTFPSVENRQTLFFSATFSPQIMQLSNMFCKPKSVIVRNKNRDLNQRVLQEIIEVPYENRKAFLFKFFDVKRLFPLV
ncbi:RNA helicase [Aphelenchoides besseyi]|nr:RNA helicase [Aphelenchoides besseyi]